MRNVNRKILFFISFFALSINLHNIYILKFSPITGYSISIYDQLPASFWYSQILVYFLGTLLVLQKREKIFRILSIPSLIVNYVIFLAVPHALGYFIYDRLDDMTNLGEIIQLINNHHTSLDNFYPSTHFIYGMTALVTNIEPPALATTIPIYFSLGFFLSIILLSRMKIKDENILYLLVPISLIYYLRYYYFSLAPHFNFYVILVIIIYVIYNYFFVERNKLSFALILVIFLLVIPFSHPFITFTISYIFVFLITIAILKKKFCIFDETLNFKLSSVFKVLAILWISFIIWVFNNVYLNDSTKEIVHSLISQSVGSVIIKAAEGGASKLYLQNYFLAIFLDYGRYLIPLFTIFIIFIIILFFKKNPLPGFYFFLALFLIFLILDLFFIFNPFIPHVLFRVTVLNYFIYGLIPLFSISIYNLLLPKNSYYKTKMMIVLLLLTLTFMSSLYGAHPSKFTLAVNTAITHNEVAGMKWLFEDKGAEPIIDVGSEQTGWRFADLFFGRLARSEREDVPILITPNHLGYNSTHFDLEDFYVIITSLDESAYNYLIGNYIPSQAKYVMNPQFESSDSKRIRNYDTHILKIYHNLNMEIFKGKIRI